MKTRILAFAILAVIPCSLFADTLKPYILAGVDDGTRDDVQARVEERLTAEGFEVVGSYVPAGDETLGVVCVTHERLKTAAADAGGLLGFAAVLRVGLRDTGEGVEVSFTNPLYWGNAYYRKTFPDVEASSTQVDAALRRALGELPDSRFEPFGSRKGVPASKLRKYHYMMAMPYFDDVAELDKGSSYEDAVARIEERAAAEDAEAKIVYAVKFPEKKMALFGTALTGRKGEAHFLPKIDFSEPRHVPFLPYELLVLEDRVVSLHGKYRIALSFPDLSMGTFMKIVSTPGDIADAQRTLVVE